MACAFSNNDCFRSKIKDEIKTMAQTLPLALPTAVAHTTLCRNAWAFLPKICPDDRPRPATEDTDYKQTTVSSRSLKHCDLSCGLCTLKQDDRLKDQKNKIETIAQTLPSTSDGCSSATRGATTAVGGFARSLRTKIEIGWRDVGLPFIKGFKN